MKKQEYRAEGIFDKNDKTYFTSITNLLRAKSEGKILQSRCLMCDAEHNLHLKLGDIKAIIPREEVAIGIKENTVKDVAIITRVNKMVCFKVIDIIEQNNEKIAVLSRRAAQLEYEEYFYEHFNSGDIIDARITHLEQFGAFVDVGCGVVSMISIDNISVSRIEHPKNRFYAGMDIRAVIKSVDAGQKRIVLSHKELLGTWLENASFFSAGETVSGIVRSIESYGVFIELRPNLAGLSELTNGIEVGDRVSVFIKSIIPEKMKIKLAIVDAVKESEDCEPFEYIYTDNKIKYWKYSPECCEKTVETLFESSVIY